MSEWGKCAQCHQDFKKCLTEGWRRKFCSVECYQRFLAGYFEDEIVVKSEKKKK